MARQRDFDRQTSSASSLLIILASIVYWQIREIERLLPKAREQGIDLAPLKHLSPISWENVLLYGEYNLSRNLVRTG